jgi:hypothetical protein
VTDHDRRLRQLRVIGLGNGLDVGLGELQGAAVHVGVPAGTEDFDQAGGGGLRHAARLASAAASLRTTEVVNACAWARASAGVIEAGGRAVQATLPPMGPEAVSTDRPDPV